MKKIIIPILLGLSFFAVSCEKLLDIPQKGVVSLGDFYASDADAQAALADMYATFLTNVAGTQGIDNPEQVMLNYSADDILAAGGHIADHEDFRVFCEFRYDNANGTLKEAYQRYLTSVIHANMVISNFSTENRAEAAPKFESTFTKQCVEEARVMRAYLHMMLALGWRTARPSWTASWNRTRCLTRPRARRKCWSGSSPSATRPSTPVSCPSVPAPPTRTPPPA